MASTGIDHFVMAITSGVDHFVMAITSDVRNKAYQLDDHHSATTEECSHDDDECQPVLRGRRPRKLSKRLRTWWPKGSAATRLLVDLA